MTLKVGALFAGYGGIELALGSVLDTEPAWFSEFDKAPSAILAHHWPDVPNLGDVTKIDWAAVEPVDIITGGSPCQDLSHAGKRAGMKAGTRSGLWASMCDAIDIIRPRLVVWENVRGAFSAEADSAVEPCPICVGDRGRVTLRALGRVLGDLAELGYDARWYGLRAADVGAAHGRFRVFVFATAPDSEHTELEGVGALPGLRRGSDARPDLRVQHVPGQLTLLPTPAVNDMGAAYTPETWDAWTEKMKASHGNGNGHGKSLSIEAQRHVGEWGEYEPAVRRQEEAFGRPAPSPTRTRADGKVQLAPEFSEWLMGLPEGHVTNPAIGISRSDRLKALGNGVVPQQCAAAFRAFLADTRKERAA